MPGFREAQADRRAPGCLYANRMIRCVRMDSTFSLPLACPDCAARMPETAAYCPGCGRSMKAAPAPPTIPPPSQPFAGRPSEVAVEQAPEAELEVDANHRFRDRVGFLAENVAGALAYLTFIPAIVFLLRPPYRQNPFVRFHSVQCLLVWVVVLASAAAIRLLAVLLYMIPVVGPLFVWIISIVASLAAFVLWLVLVVKAAQGEWFKLPELGEFAEQHAIAP